FFAVEAAVAQDNGFFATAGQSGQRVLVSHASGQAQRVSPRRSFAGTFAVAGPAHGRPSRCSMNDRHPAATRRILHAPYYSFVARHTDFPGFHLAPLVLVECVLLNLAEMPSNQKFGSYTMLVLCPSPAFAPEY